ncbi:MotA/TolQ/ExbB proton channel family protein [Helicobacter sp. 11S02629-2]|uniref:MotA/TolQ/ExbB proton channel family protein n=1 Tax=Helicobacter sp. 11S02629-2 TaxID=1476195 RepID=UPI000BA7506D|nr:MotA/TolQ/ExbB proton channel family protein [Helicobacter sp. 11S02629-2]PAF45903.1 hypothetical protein BKH40_00385 [Helicobacter sp. 11S02629-2]
MESIINFFATSSIITILVIIWLSIYFIATFWLFIYKWFLIKNVKDRENLSLEMLLTGNIFSPKSAVFNNLKNDAPLSKEMLSVWKNQILKASSAGFTFLSVVSSTAPFIGLFGTVVEILDAFSKLGVSGNATFDVIAPVISKALVATACGILAAIPAYSFYLILKRKLLELSVLLQAQADISLNINKR